MENNHTRPYRGLITTLEEDTHRKTELCDIEEELQLHNLVTQG